LATPADFSCSSSVSVDFLSSLANSATVVLDICCVTFGGGQLLFGQLLALTEI